MKLGQRKALQTLLQPLKGATVTVQPNLVTKGGDLERELGRMRMLMARVAGRLEGIGEEGDGEEDMDVDEPDEAQKVRDLLALRL